MCKWTNCPTTEELELRLTTLMPLSPRPEIATSSLHQPLLPSECTDCFWFKNEEELFELSKGYTLANTNRSTKWALKVRSQARNQRYPEDPIPENLLTSCDPVLLNTHLARFTVEARKTNGVLSTRNRSPTTM